MAQVSIEIGGRAYTVACRDGEEEHLRKLGRVLDGRASEARRAVGGVNEVRQLLLAGLLLADELNSAETGAPRSDDPAAADMVERLAARIEGIADALEREAASA